MRFLSHARPRSPADWVAAMAASPHLALGLDSYSAGPGIARLEARVADLLGKPAALWFPKGVTAQQAALKVHAARAGRTTVAIHPKSHIALEEAGALERLAGLTGLQELLLAGNPLATEAGAEWRVEVLRRLPRLLKLDGVAVEAGAGRGQGCKKQHHPEDRQADAG